MIGQTISHYRILEKLGQGGMGVVYKAEDTELRRTVALKFLVQGAIDGEEARARFLREARMAAALNHPNICTIHEVGETRPSGTSPSDADAHPAGTPFIAMEFIQGETLAEVLRRSGSLRGAKLLDVALQVAEGLAAAHAEGIVHRDLKPQNVMVTANGRIKILDFGLAKPTATGPAGAGPEDAVTETLLATGPHTVMGTVSYMSPEQARGQPVDSRSDIFSFGTMLYEMATGKRPFRGETTTDTLAKILEAEPEPPSVVTRTVPSALERIISRCLRKRPEDRYNDTRDLVAELRGLQETGVPARTPARKLRVALGVGAALVILVAAVFLWWQWSNRLSPPASADIRATRIAGESFASGNPQPTIYPDGRFLVYTNRGNLNLAVIGSGEVQMLLHLEGVRYFNWVSWHPDGVRLLTEEERESGRFETWITNVLTKRREQIRDTDEPTYPEISPDGESLSFLRDDLHELRIGPLAGGEGSPIVRVGELEDLSPPVWAPNGKRLAYTVRDLSDVDNAPYPGKRTTLETADLAGKRSVLLEDRSINASSGIVDRLCWLPDGRLVFSKRTGGSSGVFVVVDVDMDTGQLREGPRRFFGIDYAHLNFPAASVDGKRLVFQRAEWHRRLMLLEVDGAGASPDLRPVSVEDWPAYAGVWSDDGQRLFFGSERRVGDRDIYVRDLNTERETPFVVTPEREFPPMPHS